MTPRTSSFIKVTVLVWSLAVSALAQTNLSIRMQAIRIASDGALHLDLVLSDAMFFVVERSTNLVNWTPFWDVLPGGGVSDSGDLGGAMGGLAGPLELRYSTLPSGSMHFFRCRIVDAMRPVPQQNSPQTVQRASNKALRRMAAPPRRLEIRKSPRGRHR
jgi:hypothetical protein